MTQWSIAYGLKQAPQRISRIAVGLAIAWAPFTRDALVPRVRVSIVNWTCSCGQMNAPWSPNCWKCRRFLWRPKTPIDRQPSVCDCGWPA